jgi:hypothetical protein
MSFESLYATFRGVRSLLVWWDGVMYDVLRREESDEGRRSFVVEYLNFEVMAEVTEKGIGG